MNDEIKIIYDECLGAPVVEVLRPFLQRSGVMLTVKAVVEYQKSGTADSIWIPKIGQEGGWIVVSADRGKSGEPIQQKLPYLCQLHKISHILLSARVHELKLFGKGQALVAVWQDILKVRVANPGSRFVLKKKNRGDGFALINCDPQPPIIEEIKERLFDDESGK